ncbi:MAG TPA: isochorismatase family protein [Terrimicrobiaceae bacterium]|nr:isochorismatase family protein [Terrimicrobiaceae bacterium]
MVNGKLPITGLIAHTCVEATVRYAAEPGYEVTLVKDRPRTTRTKRMHAALDVNIPNYASAIVTRVRWSARSLLSGSAPEILHQPTA